MGHLGGTQNQPLKIKCPFDRLNAHVSLKAMPTPIRVTIWNEFIHERQNPTVAAIYPTGIHGLLAEVLSTNDDLIIRTATLDEPEPVSDTHLTLPPNREGENACGALSIKKKQQC